MASSPLLSALASHVGYFSLLPGAAGALQRLGSTSYLQHVSGFASRSPAGSSTAKGVSSGKPKPGSRGKAAGGGGKAAGGGAAKAAKAAAPKAKPPRAVSAYICFIKETRDQWFAPGQPGPEGLKRAGAAWRGMGDAEKVRDALRLAPSGSAATL